MKAKIEGSQVKSDLKMFLSIGKKCWIYILATFLNFCATLIVFPAATVLVESSNSDPGMDLFIQIYFGKKLFFSNFKDSDWTKTYFVPVCCFVAFNLADYIGKTVAV